MQHSSAIVISSAFDRCLSPLQDEHKLLLSQNGIDIGEATLITATIQESASFLVSGDKKCLNALVAKDLDSIHKKMQGRVICLEQIICKSIGKLL